MTTVETRDDFLIDFLATVTDETWDDSARCRLGNPYGVNPELFWPVGDSDPARAQEALAKAECAQCPVASFCLRRGLDEPEGVWGGTTPDERRAMRKRSTRVAA